MICKQRNGILIPDMYVVRNTWRKQAHFPHHCHVWCHFHSLLAFSPSIPFYRVDFLSFILYIAQISFHFVFHMMAMHLLRSDFIVVEYKSIGDHFIHILDIQNVLLYWFCFGTISFHFRWIFFSDRILSNRSQCLVMFTTHLKKLGKITLAPLMLCKYSGMVNRNAWMEWNESIA